MIAVHVDLQTYHCKNRVPKLFQSQYDRNTNIYFINIIRENICVITETSDLWTELMSPRPPSGRRKVVGHEIYTEFYIQYDETNKTARISLLKNLEI